MPTRVDVNIYEEQDGSYRVYKRGPDPVTGKSKKFARRFPRATAIAVLRAYRDIRSTPAQHGLLFRLQYRVQGGHIWCRVFERRAPGGTWAKNGDLVFSEASWPAFRDLLHVAGVDVLAE